MVAFDPAFDAPENVFEEDGLGASPSAPDPSEEGGDKKEEKSEPGDEEKEEPCILGSECEAEQVETAVDDIEENGGVAIDVNPRQENVDGDEEEGAEASPSHPRATDIGGVDGEVGTVLIDGRDGIEVGFFGLGGHRRGYRGSGRRNVNQRPTGALMDSALAISSGEWWLRT